MNKNNIPHYLKNEQRKLSWAHRNPKMYIGLFSTGCLLIFFSRPIYDIFIREYPESELAQPARK